MSPTSDEIRSCLDQAASNRHRQLFILSGSERTCLKQAGHLLDLACLRSCVAWLGSGAPELIKTTQPERVNTLLGSEFSAAVVNAFSGFECDAVAALEGTITAGGALIVLTPELEHWPVDPRCGYQRFRTTEHKSRFVERFVRLLFESTQEISATPGCTVRALRQIAGEQAPCTDGTDAQMRIVNALLRHPYQDEVHTLLIAADRGRGKSAALGIAAAQLLKNPELKIVISAPVKRAAKVFFRHMTQSEVSTAGIHQSEHCQYCPPDQLEQLTGQFDLLIIDEAASIPLPLLLNAARRFPHAVFATTIKGYEGAGRGFAIRFTHLLEQEQLAYRHLTLEHPFRWSPNDPLESFCNSAFMLDAPLLPAIPVRSSSASAKPGIRYVPADDLVQDETQLRVVFGLLLQAHYKTTPNDLRHILDGRNLRTWTLQICDQTIGTALVAAEGPLTDLSLREGVLAKRRRPTGHLLPQLLSQYTQAASALDMRIARVVRIAVHPQHQRRGLGSELLMALATQLAEQGFDAVGAMFSAVPETTRFWDRNNYIRCHLGSRRQTSSGYRSITMVYPITTIAREVCTLAHALHTDTQSFHSGKQSEQLHPLRGKHYDRMVLQRFARGERSFTDSHAALARIATRAATRTQGNTAIGITSYPTLDGTDRALLTEVQSPRASILSLKANCKLPGKKAVEQKLRKLASLLLIGEACFPANNEPADPE